MLCYQLLENITPRILSWSPHQLLGDVFQQMTNFLQGYTDYMQEYALVIKHMPDIRESKETRAIIEVCIVIHCRFESIALLQKRALTSVSDHF
jgi:hypothetical protein